jgi:aquaporin Z
MASRNPRGPVVLTAACFSALFGFLLLYAWVLHPQVEVEEVRLEVTDVAASRRFFEDVLDFRTNGDAVVLGEQRVVLRQRIGKAPVAPAAANDVAFEHVAIVVSDIDAASEQLHRAGVKTVSEAPQRLPHWNRDVRGIAAQYFRDPDGHFLELIQYPPRVGEPRWQDMKGRLFLGIDHTAIVVTDTERSRAFYRDELGLARVGESFNSGPEQEALSGVPGARVRVTSMHAGKGPGIELLEYQSPGVVGRVPSSDWTIALRSDVLDAPVSRGDPDGHRLALTPAPHAGLSFAAMALRHHGSRYWKEGAQLGVFMIVTLWLTLLLEHPKSPVRRRLKSGLLRRLITGAMIGVTAAALINSPWGSQTGAHFNPAVTLASLFMGRINPWDAFFYVLAQFLGGWLGLIAASLPFREAAANEKVDFAATLPKQGIGWTLVAEAAISFVLLAVLLIVQRHAALKPYVAWFAAALLFLYISFESPVSGMSLNPARSAASAIPARNPTAAWPYFIAPIAGMVLAATVFGDS